MGCDKEVNISFIAGVGLTGDNCVGAFQPIATNASSSDYDMILGMAFLRNVYLLVNYGDFQIGTTSRAAPFVQLLSTSNDTSVLHQEFVQVRLNGVDTTGSQTLLTPDTSGMLSPSTSSSSSSSDNTKRILIYAGIGAGGLAVALLLGYCISSMCRRRSRSEASGILPSPWEGRAGRYQPLRDPAPAAATEMYAAPYAPQYSSAYRPPPSYSHPWENR